MAALAAEFAAARPFPHVVLGDFLAIEPTDVLEEFPSTDEPGWLAYGETYQAEKRTFSDMEQMPETIGRILRELSGTPFLTFLERVTGIRGLIPDPYLQGAGLHCSGPGGLMAPHTDSHLHKRLTLYKRVNVLVYLNPGWQEGFGGCLELFDPADVRTPVKTVVPSWGTCVIFRTDGKSVHGFPKPIRDGRVRRTLAMYYYTSVDNPEFSGSTLTTWRRDDEYWSQTSGSWLAQRLRMQLFRVLRFGSFAFAALAHRARPRTSTHEDET